MLTASFVFLDCDVFVTENFDYHSPRLSSLTALAGSGRIQVFLTDITLREIKANLGEAIAEAVSATAARPRPILRHSKTPAVKQLFVPLDRAALEAELLAQLDEFLKAAKVTVLKVDPNGLPAVFDKYFAKSAPFGSGKNKAEFPDAFAIETLLNWCAEKDLIMAVVSRDGGVIAACPDGSALRHFASLAEYLDAVSSEEVVLRRFITKQLKRRRKQIEEGAKQAFSHMGYFLRDMDGDVEEVRASEVDYDDDDATFITVQPDRAIVEFFGLISFEADLVFSEPGSGTYDKEDGVILFQTEIEETVERETERGFGVEVTYKQRKPSTFRIRKVWFEGSESIGVTSDWEKRWSD